MNPNYLLLVVFLFVAVALALEGLTQMWASKHSASAKRLAARLQAIETGSVVVTSGLERDRTPGRWLWLDEQLAVLPGGDRLLRYVETSGTGKSAGGLMAMSIALGSAGFLVPMLMARPLVFSVFGTLVTATLPWLWLARRRDARMRVFEAQIPEALDLMGRAMRAGHAFSTVVKMVGDEMQEPIGQEFRTLFDEMNYGVPQNEALLRLAQRVPIADLAYFVVAVTIQRETGGNLAEILDNLAHVVRERFKILRQVRVHTAHGRFTGYVLLALPAALAVVLAWMNPDHMDLLFKERMGQMMIMAAIVMQTIGYFWIRQVIKIEV